MQITAQQQKCQADVSENLCKTLKNANLRVTAEQPHKSGALAELALVLYFRGSQIRRRVHVQATPHRSSRQREH